MVYAFPALIILLVIIGLLWRLVARMDALVLLARLSTQAEQADAAPRPTESRLATLEDARRAVTRRQP